MNSILKTFATCMSLACGASSVLAYTEYSGTMNDFMGINIHSVLWKDYYKDINDPSIGFSHTDISQAFKWARNYQRWDQFEPENDDYQWMSKDGGRVFYFDEYYRLLNEDGVNLVVVPMDPPLWVGSSIQLPIDNGTGEEPNHYRERAEYVAQMAARYGPTGGLSASRLETLDKVQGLDYVRYFEDHNEPNQDWREDIWPADYYGQYLNAFHDGRGVIRDGSMPIAGVKQGDPNAFHVAGGLNNNGIDDSYLEMMFLSAGRQAFDIINIHTYCRNTHLYPANTWPWPPEAKGTSPEYYIIESGLEEIQQTIEWRDTNLPGTPVWVTEFGWDTYEKPDGTHSTNYAPEVSQANYIMRTFPLFKMIGVDKAFLFYDFDPNSTSPKMFSSSGIFKDKTLGHESKPSYFYMTAMSQAIGEYAYDGAHLFGQGDPEVYAYSFSKSDTDVVLMIWCRERDTLFDNGTTTSNYTLAVPYVEDCELITPTDNIIGGVSSVLNVSQAGQSGASVTIPLLSETPVFLKLSGTQNIRPNLAPEVSAGKDFEVQLPATVCTVSCEASDADGSIASYQWTQLSGPSLTIQQPASASTQLGNLSAGDYVFQVEATDDDGATVRDVVAFSVTNRTTYLSSRFAIPGLIEAEDYDAGGEGITYHDTTPGNSKGKYRQDDVDLNNFSSGGYYITDVVAGEWVDYSVTIAESGLYSMNLRIAAYNDDRRVKVLMDGVTVSGMMQVIKTGDWDVFADNIAAPVNLTAGDHVMRVYFDTSGVVLDSIDIQPYDDGSSVDGYLSLSNIASGWQTLRIFYENNWLDDVDVLAGGNQFLELYLTDESAGLTADWTKLKIALQDTSQTLAEVAIGDYETNIGVNWTLVQIPLADFAALGVDLNHIRFIAINSAGANAFDIGVDEIIFNGGSNPFVWMGETHPINPVSNSNISHTFETTGGVGWLPPYNEPPFVDAGVDVTIRPLADSYTFVSNVYDIDGLVTGYEWAQLSGPNPVQATGIYGPDLSVQLDTFGTYVFRLTATDDSGATCEDDVTLIYEDTGGYLSIDHTAANWRTFSIFYDVERLPMDVIGRSSFNTDLELYLKRFDLTYPIDWTRMQIELTDASSVKIAVSVSNYETTIDGQWVKVTIPLSDFGAVDLSQLSKVTIISASAGPFYSLGIDEIRFVGGATPVLWYGDDHSEVDFSAIPAEMTVINTETEGVVQPTP